MSPASPHSRIALGTVQFGQRYGIANRTGQVGPDEAAAILAIARAAGIDMLDTAIAYGESEQRLGDIGVAGWNVVSKLPPIPPDCADVRGWVRESVRGSLARLRVERLYGLLLHRSADIQGPHGPALRDALIGLQREGVVGKVGVSVYAPADFEALWPHFRPDIVQAPFNVLDRRLVTSGWIERLRAAAVEVHVRSVFLQGLLLMAPGTRPRSFERWQPLWDHWHRWLIQAQVDPVGACLGFALSTPAIDRVVVGVDSAGHLRALLASVTSIPALPPDELQSSDLDLINPSRWDTH